VLAELAIANAAFAVIKETIANGGDIMSAGQHIFKFFDLKSEISKKASGSGSDSEAFFALEQIKQHEIQLKELMIYQGRGGLWDEWLAFQVEARKKREAEARAIVLKKRRRIQAIKGVLTGVAVFLLGVTGIGVVLLLVWFVVTKGGQQ
jgi:hypothetical protein